MQAEGEYKRLVDGYRLGSVHDPFDEVELREDVRQMLRALTPRQRAALLLLNLYDYDTEGADHA